MSNVVVTRKCLDCSQAFAGAPASRYCKPCKLKRATHVCENCDVTFTQKTRGHSSRFCSPECRIVKTVARGRTGGWTPTQREAIMNADKTCEACNDSYVGHVRSRYCKSPACVRERNKTKAERYRAKDDHVQERTRMLEDQGGLCAICKTEIKVPNLDHCHTTGVYRGVLCYNCNVAIGFMKDNPQILRAAADYLERTCACACS